MPQAPQQVLLDRCWVGSLEPSLRKGTQGATGHLMSRLGGQVKVQCWLRSAALHCSIWIWPPCSCKHFPLLGFFRRFSCKKTSEKCGETIQKPNEIHQYITLVYSAWKCSTPLRRPTPVVAPHWCPSLSAGKARSSLTLAETWHEDTAAFQYYDAAPYEMYTQSTRGHNHPIRFPTVPERTKLFWLLILIKFESESLYLVASHVVTLVHDHRFTSLVAFSNIQAGLRSWIFNLVQTRTHNKSKIQPQFYTTCAISTNRQRETWLTAPNFTGVKSGMKTSG